MKNHYFRNKPKILIIAVAIGFFSTAVRLLTQHHFNQTSLLYIGIPFLVSLLLIQIRDPDDSPSWKKHYLNRVIDAFIIMLGSSILLYEGFVCVVMFMPIYLIVILIMFLFDALRRYLNKSGRSTLGIQILPLFMLISAFEGVSPELSYPRDEQVTVTRIVQSSIAEIKQNLIQPIHLQKPQPWFLKLFPMPHTIKAETLTAGDVHEVHFKYYRWFFTNSHEGRMLLEITEVDVDRIKTTILEDTSYISNYLQLKGTEIKLDKIDNQHTRITLTIAFKRTLDPYWYIAPVERYGISKIANLLVSQVIAHETN